MMQLMPNTCQPSTVISHTLKKCWADVLAKCTRAVLFLLHKMPHCEKTCDGLFAIIWLKMENSKINNPHKLQL